MKILLSQLVVALCALGTSSAFVVLPPQQAPSKTSLTAASQYLGGLGGEKAQQTGQRVQMDTNIPTGDLAPGRMPPTDAGRDTVRIITSS